MSNSKAIFDTFGVVDFFDAIALLIKNLYEAIDAILVVRGSL